MDNLSMSLAVLSAMITPAVLISACGSLLLTTSQRLSRVIDRTRKIADLLEALAGDPEGEPLRGERRQLLLEQLGTAAHRARLLQRAISCLYLTLSVFVGTSVAIGIVSVGGYAYTWLPIVLGIAGAAMLFAGSLLLIAETRLALRAVNREMDFVLRFGRHYAPTPQGRRDEHDTIQERAVG